MAGPGVFDIQGRDALSPSSGSSILSDVFARTGAFAVGRDASATDGTDAGGQGAALGGKTIGQTVVLVALIGGAAWVLASALRR